MKAFAEMTPDELRDEKKAFARRLGSRVREARQNAKLSQEKLAALAGYHYTYIGNIENAVNLPSSHTVWRLARAMGADPGDLMRNL